MVNRPSSAIPILASQGEVRSGTCGRGHEDGDELGRNHCADKDNSIWDAENDGRREDGDVEMMRIRKVRASITSL